MKINKYKYKYIKSLIKQFRKKLPTSNFKKQDIKNAVYGELRKLDYIQKISKNYEKRNIIDQIVYEEKIDKAFDKQRHLLKYHQLKQENKRLRDIIQQSISESVRNFIADKLAERRIESEDNMYHATSDIYITVGGLMMGGPTLKKNNKTALLLP